MRWMYTFEHASGMDELSGAAERLGNEGWELVSVVSHDGDLWMFFQKPVADSSSAPGPR